MLLGNLQSCGPRSQKTFARPMLSNLLALQQQMLTSS